MRLIIFAAAWALGISAARALSSIQPSAWLTLIIVTGIAGLLLRRRLAWWIPVGLIAFAAGGFRLAALPNSSDIARHNGHSGTILGLVVSQPKLREDKIQLRLESETIFVNNQLSETSGFVLVEADRARLSRMATAFARRDGWKYPPLGTPSLTRIIWGAKGYSASCGTPV